MELHPHQLNLISNRDLIAEYEQAVRMKDTSLEEQLRKELVKRNLWPITNPDPRRQP
jgi:hypothetical protein